ncbi:MAG: glutathione peroxidase [Pseudomonadota bacterium]
MLTRRLFVTSILAMPAVAMARDPSAFDFSFTDIDGAPLELAQFQGRPVMIVNTASRCGFTYQYDALQALYDRYRDRGFVLIGVPSDDFGGQELATEAEVKEFCAVNFALDFPLTEITHVRGPDAHPFYRWARAELGPDQAPGWNFHKYLIAPNGQLAGAFGTRIEPDSADVTAAVEALLPAG